MVEATLKVRPVKPADEEILYLWRNQSWIVALGSSKRIVMREEHAAWFAETLTSEKRVLLIVEVDFKPAGMIRYDQLGSAACEISLYLLPEHIGVGRGTASFRASIPELLSWCPVKRIVARVMRGNQRSLDFFLRLGFLEDPLHSTPDTALLFLEGFGEPCP